MGESHRNQHQVQIIFTVGLVTLRQLSGEGPDPLAPLEGYVAGIIQTVWVMPPLLGDGNWACSGNDDSPPHRYGN